MKKLKVSKLATKCKTDECYAVLLNRGVRKPFLAFGKNEAGPTMFYSWANAMSYRRELERHGLHGRVVKVRFTIEVLTKGVVYAGNF